jgi:phosphoribosylformylglycinamidine synthase
VSGNVSLYNEAGGRAVPPTPTVGMVGLLPDVSLAVRTGFEPGCAVIVLGAAPLELGASEFMPDANAFPRFDLQDECRLGSLLRDMAARRLLSSAQDVADGGLAVALAECALLGNCGLTLERVEGPSPEVALFSEDQGRAVVTCRPDNTSTVLNLAGHHGVPATIVGVTGGDRLTIVEWIDLTIDDLRTVWESQA